MDQPPQDSFEVQVNVVSDPGKPVAGAEILSGNKLLSKSGAAGAATVRVAGKDGDQVDLTVKCPEGYEAPAAALTIPLRRLAPGSRPAQFEARCAPLLRTIVVAIRATNGPNLPVLYLGREVARTDASGAAQFVVHVKPAEQVEVTLNTEDAGTAQLQPRNPTLTFVAKDADDFVTLDQVFTVQAAPVHHVASQRPRPL